MGKANIPLWLLMPKGSGGSEKEEQEKSVSIVQNGTSIVTPDANKTLSKVTISTNVPQAIPIEIATASAMDALLVAANVGKAYLYTGTTTADYTNGDIYVVEEA